MFVWQFAFDSACLKEFFHVAEKNPATQALQCLSKFTFDVCYLVSHLLTPIYVYVVVLLSFCQDSIFIKKFNSDDNLSSMSLEPWTFGMRKDNNTTTYISKLQTKIKKNICHNKRIQFGQNDTKGILKSVADTD